MRIKRTILREGFVNFTQNRFKRLHVCVKVTQGTTVGEFFHRRYCLHRSEYTPRCCRTSDTGGILISDRNDA